MFHGSRGRPRFLRPAVRRRICFLPLFSLSVHPVEEILPRLPEVFDKNDVIRLLGWSPSRATLFRALESLVVSGRLIVERFGGGRVTTMYRQKMPEPVTE